MNCTPQIRCSKRDGGNLGEKMHVFYTNADSLLNKLTELKVILSRLQPISSNLHY